MLFWHDFDGRDIYVCADIPQDTAQMRSISKR